MTPNPTWYVCRVISRQERKIVASLEEKGLTAYCPMERKWSLHARPKVAVSRALFPGYVFAILPDDEALDEARKDRRVREIMCDKFGNPIVASTRSLRGLFIADMFHEFDHTYVAPKPKKVKGRRYSPKWKPGQQVKIVSGAMEGFVGQVIRAKGKARFDLLLNIFGRDQEVNVPQQDIEAVETQDIAPSLAA